MAKATMKAGSPKGGAKPQSSGPVKTAAKGAAGSRTPPAAASRPAASRPAASRLAAPIRPIRPIRTAAASRQATKPAAARRALTDDEYHAEVQKAAALADASKQVYKERLNGLVAAARLHASAKVPPGQWIEWSLTHAQDAWAALAKATFRDHPLSVETKRATASTMVGMFKHVDGLKDRLKKQRDPWLLLLKEITKVTKDKADNILPSDRQREARIEWAELVAKRDEIRDVPEKDLPHDAYLVLCLNSLGMEPGRADWGDMRIYRLPDTPPPEVGSDDEKKQNYVVIKDGGKHVDAVFNVYKTAKKYKRQVVEMVPEMVKVLLDSLARRPRQWVLQMKRAAKPYSRHSYAVHVAYILMHLFNRPATLDTLRHSRINGADIFKMTPKEMEDLSVRMRHSLPQMLRYQLRFGDDTPAANLQCNVTCEKLPTPTSTPTP